MASHSSILAWRIPWTEEPGGLQSMGLKRVSHDLTTNTVTFSISGSVYTLDVCPSLPWLEALPLCKAFPTSQNGTASVESRDKTEQTDKAESSW